MSIEVTVEYPGYVAIKTFKDYKSAKKFADKEKSLGALVVARCVKTN